jgi:hypothetical protein
MLKYHFQSTKPLELRFCALLTESGDERPAGYKALLAQHLPKYLNENG